MPSSDDSFKNSRYIRTISGRKFHLFGVDPDELYVEDISLALSHLCRFTGHVSRIYTVGEHSLLVLNIIKKMFGIHDPAIQFQALMHDATEAYLADISAPFKGSLGDTTPIRDCLSNRLRDANLLPEVFEYSSSNVESILEAFDISVKEAACTYYDLEHLVWVRIAEKYGLPENLDPVIKEADWIALFAEATELQPLGEQRTWYNWEHYGEKGLECRELVGVPNMDPVTTRSMFMQQFCHLSRALGRNNI